MNTNGWFEVDKEGLAQLLYRKGMRFILYEMVQNAWDTKAKKAIVTTTEIPGQPLVKLHVEDDDPDGYLDLSHAFRLFTASHKKGDVEKRGRFNLGEKLVLAVCKEARISSTSGTIYFEGGPTGLKRRTSTRERTDVGSTFDGVLRLTREETDEMLDGADDLLPPIETIVNGFTIACRTPLRSISVNLPTEVADAEGYMRRTVRNTMVRVYAPRPGKDHFLYEMGIPVVKIDDPWDIEVMQKIPLNADRDNVTPAYLQAVRVAVVNEMRDHLTSENVTSTAVQAALTDDRIDPAAVTAILDKQYGEKRVVFDPSDPEANSRAISQGYTVIPGRAFSSDAWRQIRSNGAALPAGRVIPTIKPYGEGGDPAVFIPEGDWTPGMKRVAELAEALALRLFGSITVQFEAKRMTDAWAANYGGRTLTFNYARLGKAWFDKTPNDPALLDLLIHEFAHEYAGNHLSDAYYKACTDVGARMVALALKKPELFQ